MQRQVIDTNREEVKQEQAALKAKGIRATIVIEKVRRDGQALYRTLKLVRGYVPRP